ncbi:MAG: hypothetical protein IPJ40_04155 [Saprospirales bacterium]|nr:hypothetical protein [Saprospirales bacterium]
MEALISKATREDMPFKRDGWQFTWKKLIKTEGALLFKIAGIETPNQIEGLIMLTLLNDELLFMNDIEVAPHHFGSGGKYENVAGCLLAFACYKSFELGKGHYLGYLSFDSKTELIELYEKKYGATFAAGQKLFFDPAAGKNLMKQYLNIG